LKSEIFVFLLSPNSIEKKSHALRELTLAKDKWKNPTGHILPVRVKATLLRRVDPYLKSVTILRPEGNIPAAVSDAIARLGQAKTSTPVWSPLAGIAADRTTEFAIIGPGQRLP
jgi:hypothetical protein